MPDWRLFRVKSCSAWRLIQSCYHPRETKAMAAACGRRSVAGGVQWRRVARGQERSTSAQPDSGIEQLLHSENELLPPKSLVENARLKDYAAEYKRSIEDPEAFWSAAANELEWFQPWTKVFDWKYPTFEWFQGGKFNITHNCLDRQVKSGRKNKVAYIWVGEDGAERQVTYGQLLDLVGRTANALKSLGVKKGDRVKGGASVLAEMAEVVGAGLESASKRTMGATAKPDFENGDLL